MENNGQNAQVNPQGGVGVGGVGNGAVGGPMGGIGGAGGPIGVGGAGVPVIVQPPKSNKFKINAWSSVSVTILSAIAITPLLFNSLIVYRFSSSSITNLIVTWVISLVGPVVPSAIIWIIFLVLKKEGAHGWIVGPLVLLAVGAAILGGCMVMINGATW